MRAWAALGWLQVCPYSKGRQLAVTQDGPLLRPRARLDDQRVMVRREGSAIENGTAGLDWPGLGRTILLNCLKRLL